MAAGFKSATVNAGSVPATQTNMPAYVDLSRIGITTLAEAQSARVYADSAKTTEWAREIVSVTEMHVKIPSLTSTVSMFVDWDGVRADYAVTDTYGRNNVWSNYLYVGHLQTNSVDSTGIADGTDTSMSYSSGDGKLGNGGAFNGSSSKIALGTDRNIPSGQYLTVSAWVKTAATTSMIIAGKTNFVGGSTDSWYLYRPYVSGTSRLEGFTRIDSNNYYLSPTGSVPMSSMTHVALTHDRVNMRLYANGSLHSTSGSQTGSNIASNTGTVTGGAAGVPSTLFWNGSIDELRISSLHRSSNWLTTEYNNQNDEATFWGTWTNAGGGGGFTPTPMLHMMQIAGVNM